MNRVVWFLSAVWTAASTHGSVFTVTSAVDSGPGTLRQALLDANTSAGPDLIQFALPGSGPFTIRPLTGLPGIYEPVTIDGAAQPGYSGAPVIELDGSLAGSSAYGLRILSSNCIVRALAISRFGRDGIRIENYGGNAIQGCRIGTDLAGTTARPNAWNGIAILTASNLVGGALSGQGNLISGGTESGIYMFSMGARGNVVEGNWIGVDATGSNRLGNAQNGIAIADGQANRIGGIEPGSGNVIAGNGQAGIYLINNARGNVIQGNCVGLAAHGRTALSNAWDGIIIAGGSDNVVGGTEPGAGNIISGNGLSGILVSGLASTRNLIQGNRVGTDATGRLAAGNRHHGIALAGAPTNYVGGPTPAECNQISGNNASGILISGTNAFGNRIRGNRIGTDPDGVSALGNAHAGIGIEGAPGNWIGGLSAGDRNLISGNGDSGIYLNLAATTATVIQGNWIGVDAAGTRALPNQVGGIYIYNSASNVVGGVVSGAGNLISGNQKDGISIGDPSSVGNVVEGNWIGIASDGATALGNQWHNIEILNQSCRNRIGGDTAGAANRISHARTAGYDGVRVRDGCDRNWVLGNAIVGNGGASDKGLGIDLGPDGVTLNDALDADTGGNQRQNFPVLEPELRGCRQPVVRGVLASQPNLDYRLEFFGNTVPEPSAYGEGERFLGSVTVRTGGDGAAPFEVIAAAVDEDVRWITATATDADGNTSEFSASAAVLLDTTPPVLSGCPTNVTVESDEVPAPASPTATDNGGGTPKIDYAEVRTDGPCPGRYTLTRTWTATDDCGNSSSCSQTITVLEAGPILSVQAMSGGTAIQLSWVDPEPLFVLEQTFHISPSIQWMPVTNAVSMTNDVWRVVLPIGDSNMFFRLNAAGQDGPE